MDQEKFDNLARCIASLASRRRLLVGTGTGLAAVLGSQVSQSFDPSSAEGKAKHKKRNKRGPSAEKKKKKKKKTTTTTTTTTVSPIAPSFACNNLNTACSANSVQCNCRQNKAGNNVCLNVITPPNGVTFLTCALDQDCRNGEFCDVAGNQCRTGCAT